jgi:hypothetical protein
MRRETNPEELRRFKEEETETVLRDFLLLILFLLLQIVLDPLRTSEGTGPGGGALDGWR